LERILTEVKKAPKELDKLYEETLHKVPETQKAELLQLPHWACYAARPLRLPQLRYAMFFSKHIPENQ